MAVAGNAVRALGMQYGVAARRGTHPEWSAAVWLVCAARAGQAQRRAGDTRLDLRRSDVCIR